MGCDAFEEVGEMRRIVVHVRGNEDGETGGEDLKVDREIRSLIAVYIGREGIAFSDGDVRFLMPTTVTKSGPIWKPARSFGACLMAFSQAKSWKRQSLMMPLLRSSGGMRLRKLPAESVSMAAIKGEET